MAAESAVLRRVWIALARFCCLFRTNSGKAWVSGAGPARRLADGTVAVPAGRPVALGLGMLNGSPVAGQSDLQGWTLVRVTPAMVGKVYPIYTAIEVKRSEGGRVSADQSNFVHQVRAAGGIAGVANSEAAALGIIEGWLEQNDAEAA